MDFDEYDYLERAVDGNPKERIEPRNSKDANGGRRIEKRSTDEERNGERRDHRDDRDRSSSRAEKRETDRHRGGRDGERDRERRDRDEHRERDKEKERDTEKEKERSRRNDRDVEVERERSSSRSRRHDREAEMERSRRSGSRSRRHDREVELEMERERSRRSGSRSRMHDREAELEIERERSRRHDREAELEMERERSRDRVVREREAEREMREREGRILKDRREAVELEADPERDQRTVFAYQMPLKATERDVYEFFSQVGKVRDVRLIMDRNSRRSKGVGYVEFYDVMSVQAAILLSGQLLLGQPVVVKHSEAEKNLVQSSTAGGSVLPGSDRKLYVGNLHFNMTEEQLREIFEAFGPVELVQMPLDMETGHCKGFGFVQFAQLEHAKTAQQSLNGTLEIAGRIVKVSSVIEHVGVQDTVTSATDFDDEDGGGLSLNARSRALLMQKLDRTGTASSIAESLGVTVLNGTAPTPVVPTAKVAVSAMFPTLATTPAVESIGDPSECILLKNMFDPKTETDPDFDLDIKEDVQDECSKFGPLKHIYVDKNSNGLVYLRFDSVASAIKCQRAMHMRWFARRCISATFLRPYEYEVKVRSAV